MRDVNLVSFNGPHDSYRRVVLGDLDGSVATPEGGRYADTVKCSTGLSGFRGEFGVVTSGYEDCVDVNNLCHDIDLTAKLWRLRGTMGFTVKGGVKWVRLSGPVEGRGRECDVDLGNASDQSHVYVTGVRLNLWREDGGPIYVRVLGSEFPVEEPGSGPYKYVFPWKAKWLRTITVKTFLEYRRFMQRFK